MEQHEIDVEATLFIDVDKTAGNWRRGNVCLLTLKHQQKIDIGGTSVYETAKAKFRRRIFHEPNSTQMI